MNLMAGFGKIPRVALFRPFERFFRLKASGSIVLLTATALALLWANAPFRDSYFELWHLEASVRIGPFGLQQDLLHWVNDGLMAIFFLLVGLEIKREILTGELSELSAATLPVLAAVGGMVAPAAIFLAINQGGPAASGWGIPMATDIAFALGTLALLGRRVPAALRVFLAATAIVDDIGAVVVIALFYTADLNLAALGWTAAIVAGLLFLNWTWVRSPLPYVILGVLLWLAVLESGIHATIAGVLLAFTIPASTPQTPEVTEDQVEETLEAAHVDVADHPRTESDRQSELLASEKAIQYEEAPLTRMEHVLVPWVAFAIIPVFAFTNAGVVVTPQALAEALVNPLGLGIVLGLVLGKQVGVFLIPWLAVRAGFARLPQGVTAWNLYGLSWLAGIGFTMSLFISGLALGPELEEVAKMAILTASAIAGVGGLAILAWAGSPEA